MPVSDAAHTEVLHRLDAQDRLLRQIEKHGRVTNGRIGQLELVAAIEKDRREQATKRTDRGLSRKAQRIAALAMLAGWVTVLVVILTSARF